MPISEDTFLALDIGGTNVKSGLISRAGEILSFDSFPTSKWGGPEALIDMIIRQLKTLWNDSDTAHRPRALAIGAPGWILRREGVVVMAPNIPGWKALPITRLMSEALDIPAVLENDANLYALGEWLIGAGKGCANEITLTLGTGVGGGLILEGRLWEGAFTSAAEVGHIPLGGVNRLCGCGRTGCLETVASAIGMAAIAREWLAAGRETLYKGDPAAVDTREMLRLAGLGDPMSLSIFSDAGKAIGFVLAGVFNLLGLQMAVIGGGGAGAFDFMAPGIMEVLSRHLVTAGVDQIQVVKGALGGNAPLIGAAAFLNESGY
ncbi:MAG: ROK family protein [Deltaproteobacteria bacterium]|jgi:glucokinase|nr:ROK family protein [Deltaproteobacteria bacterium]